ncbi:uncharacterized protein LOC123706181 isoform X1 [Colias croceus]|uniref:uncharacterized protein LOC123706181 isoform X1 n=1 Tax=Colias crocea TaxID=72248 RepID=UPI001E27F606|nr:uncharacterized protein LOC123706181 isoform X1 [Colias croceus]
MPWNIKLPINLSYQMRRRYGRDICCENDGAAACKELDRYLQLFGLRYGNISGAPSELEADSSKDINCQDDEFQDASNPLCPSMSLAVIKANEIVGSDVESPAAPAYSTDSASDYAKSHSYDMC